MEKSWELLIRQIRCSSQRGLLRRGGGVSGIIGGIDSNKGKDGSIPIDTYDISSSHNTPSTKERDSFSGGIPKYTN